MKVLIFVDDTILIAKSEKEMQDILDVYLSFTKTWRIRVNPTKCAIIPMSKHCTKQYDKDCAENGKQYGVWHINGEKVQMKAKHKYLGIVLSNDINHHGYKDAKSAMVIQMKSKVKMVLKTLGERMALDFCDTVLMPKITYGAEMLKITREKINQWQVQLYSVALGIERQEIWEGHSGQEIALLTMCKETERRMWHHEVGMSAWRTRRTLISNEDSLPGKIYSGLIKDNTRKKIKTNLHKCTNDLTVTVSEEEGVKFIDKSGKHGQSKMDTRMHKKKSISKKTWSKIMWNCLEFEREWTMKSMAEDQIDRIEKDNAKSDYDLVLGKGRSMAYFSTPEKANDKRKSITCMHKKKHDCTTNMVAMRKLKAGRIKHMNQNKVRNINGKSWGLMTHEQRRSITSCTCA